MDTGFFNYGIAEICYYLISFKVTEKVSIGFLYIESGSIISASNHQPRKPTPTDH
jgi:hypothetical protein